MKIIKLNQTNKKEVIAAMVSALEGGGLVIFPTETTYGAGVDATNQAAVDKLLSYKTRREGKPLSIAVPDREMAQEYVNINDSATRMYETFLPGPFTIVSKSKHKTARGVESEFGTLGVRIPDYELVLKVLREFGRPVTATSANASGKKRPYKIEDLLENLSGRQRDLIDLIVDAGELPHNKPSTIVDTTMSAPMTLRKGDREGNFGLGGRIELISESEQETMAIAGRFMLKNWNQIKNRGLVIGLDGELGAGKTIFTKGVAKFLGINEVISSPTYTYVEEYDYVRHGFAGKFFHFDVWRVESKRDLEQLGFFEFLGQVGNVVVVEWWSRVADYASEDFKGRNFLRVMIEDMGENRRKLIVIWPET